VQVDPEFKVIPVRALANRATERFRQVQVETIRRYREAGCQLGTRFACARESIAHPRFKEAFVRGSARDAQTSVQVDPEFKVIPVRALANRATERFRQVQVETIRRYREGEIDYEAAALAIEQFWAGALRRAVVDGDVEEGSLMAGQSVGMVKAVEPTAAIVDTLVTQAAAALERAERLG